MPRFKRVEPRLPVTDVATSVEFYCTQLGFTSDPSVELGADFAIICRDGVSLQLIEHDTHHPLGPFTIWVDVDDALTEFANLDGAVEVEWGPEIYDYGRREFAVLDPDRHRIIVSEPIQPSASPSLDSPSPASTTARFDLQGLFQAINAKREDQGLSWAAPAREVGVAASTIRRYSNADDAEADGVLALLRWLAVAPEAHIVGYTVSGRPLPDAGSGYVRVDMNRIAKANGDTSRAQKRTRTTIQNLTNTAQRSGQPVAALTRTSDV